MSFRSLSLLRSARVKALSFHPSRPLVLLGLYSGEVQLRDWRAGRAVRSASVCAFPVRAAAFVPGSGLCCAASDDGALRVLDASTLQTKVEVQAHSDYCRALAVRDGPAAGAPPPPVSQGFLAGEPCCTVFTAGDDGAIRSWRLGKVSGALQPLVEYVGHTHYVMALALDSAGSRLLSGSMDRTAKVWDVSPGAAVSSARGASGAAGAPPGAQDRSLGAAITGAASAVASKASQLVGAASELASGALDGASRLINVDLSSLARGARGPKAAAGAGASRPVPAFPATAGPLYTLAGHAEGVGGVAWVETSAGASVASSYSGGLGGVYMATGSDDNTVRLWDPLSRQTLRTFDCHQDFVAGLHFVPGANLLLTASEDGTLGVINAVSLCLERTLNYGLARCWCAASTTVGTGSGVVIAVGCDQGCAIAQLGSSGVLGAMGDSGRLVVSGAAREAAAGAGGAAGPGAASLEPGLVGPFSQKPGALSAAGNPARVFSADPGERAKGLRQVDVSGVVAGGAVRACFSQGSKFLLLSADPEAAGEREGPSYVVLSTLSWKPKFTGTAAGAVFLRDFATTDFLLADQGLLDDAQAEKVYARYEAGGAGRGGDGAGPGDPADLAHFDDGCWVAELAPKRKTVVLRCDGEERFSFRLAGTAERIFGGPLLVAAGAEAAAFYRVWPSGRAQFVCQVGSRVRDVVWNEAGDLLCLLGDEGLTLLAYNFGAAESAMLEDDYDEEEGCADALELLASVPGQVSTCAFAQGGRILLYATGEGEAGEAAGDLTEVRQLVLAELLEAGGDGEGEEEGEEDEEDPDGAEGPEGLEGEDSTQGSGASEAGAGRARRPGSPGAGKARAQDAPSPADEIPYISLPVHGLSSVVSILGCQDDYVYVLGEGSGARGAALGASGAAGAGASGAPLAAAAGAEGAYGVYLCRVQLDQAIVEFRQVFSSKGADAALEHAGREFAGSPANMMYAADYLLRRGVEISRVFRVLPEPAQRLRLAEKYRRVDLALDVLDSLEAGLAPGATLAGSVGLETLRRLAQAALKDGLLGDARRLYGLVGDREMQFLCCYLLGDFGAGEAGSAEAAGAEGAEDLPGSAKAAPALPSAQERPDLAYLRAVATGDRDAALACLSSPAERAAFLESNYGEGERVRVPRGAWGAEGADGAESAEGAETAEGAAGDAAPAGEAALDAADLRRRAVAEWKAQLAAQGRAEVAEGICA